MIEMKKKAIGSIKGMLEGRLAGRMRPKPPQDDESMENPSEEATETGAEEAAELPGEDQHDELPGTDKLTPEEIQQLKMLLAKMG
jgi:hypothetical protein